VNDVFVAAAKVAMSKEFLFIYIYRISSIANSDESLILKFNGSWSENYRRPSTVNPTEHYSRLVTSNIAKKFGFEKLTGFLNHKPDLI
jgi:hypothetical protein